MESFLTISTGNSHPFKVESQTATNTVKVTKLSYPLHILPHVYLDNSLVLL
ncbi:hypothetical protein SbBS512_A0308 (plasmid) [Shigella boydii CDC 3083-94]|uniref:Uncharacterized protein n=1 Tax=Shigella boydii serotype 18 (strain CDC 3083-94 / BS512) TaxID=344609 RepID=B2TT98_SHIB3|nr:hypothetical protein SbBS512_A0308 [Shigella boydii CDC 3083-94]